MSTYPSIHFSLDEDTLKITVGCPLCTYPSIHFETLRITVGCLWSTYPSIRNKNLYTCWTPWSTQETRGLWARPPVLTPVPVQAFHSRACLNLHHSDIQGEITLCQHFFEAIAKKKRPSCHCLGAWAGHFEQRHTGQRTRETTEGRCDMMQGQFFFGRWLLLVATRRRAMQRSKLDIGRADAGGMSIISGSGGASGMGANKVSTKNAFEDI